MVKFGKELLAATVPEWQPYYLNYTRLKGWIKEMESNAVGRTGATFFDARETFIEELKVNLRRVEQFYAVKEARLTETVADLGNIKRPEGRDAKEDTCKPIREEIETLIAFAFMNSEGFRKITKKFDKKVGCIEQEMEKSQRCADTTQGGGLKDRMLNLLPNLSFHLAESRLQNLQISLDTWCGDDAFVGPKLSVGNQRGSLTDFNVSLLPRLRREKKAPWRKVVTVLWNNVSVVVITCLVVMSMVFGISDNLTSRGYFVIWLTGVVLSLLVRQFPPDGVMMTATVVLNICGFLDVDTAWTAFSNDVVLSVAGLGVIASAVGETGVIDLVFSKIVGKPKSLTSALLRLLLPSVVMNLGISNTCVMSCLLPVIDKWSVEIGHHKALFLLPLSYVLLISGAFAIFSTSTNLIAQGLLNDHKLPPFDMFALAVPVTLCTSVTICYLVLLVPYFLKRFRRDTSESTVTGTEVGQKQTSTWTENRFDIRIQISGQSLAGQSLKSSGLIELLSAGFSDIAQCERYGEKMLPSGEEFELMMDDVLLLCTGLQAFVNIRHFSGISILPHDLSEIKGCWDMSSRELVEVVLDGQSPLVGHRMGTRKYRGVYGAAMVAYRSVTGQSMNKDENVSIPPQERILERGDHIVFDAPPEFYRSWNRSSDFVVVRRVTKGKEGSVESESPYAPAVAGAIMLLMVALVASETLPLVVAVFGAIALLVITRCTSLDDVIKAVKLRTVFTIVGAFGLGRAIGQEGVAKEMASLLLWLLRPFGARGLLVAIFAATVALGIVFHGTAVVVLMFPICATAAERMNLPIHQVIGVLCIAATCQMLSPISYQTNLIAYTAGGYEFSDFTKVGSVLVLLIALVGIPAIEFQFPADSV
eukprot:TRINITY_DN30939_c0_g1_i1.p1 TRINITY_DN30939_c0_g1~~TRINITY_DN30939_c0_g1_i1.p1  ORF type:complete len:873 (+),score=115.24 TRINITY_DN30939_c0_g1_i1:90-2708(+)